MRTALITTLVVGLAAAAQAQVPSTSQNPAVTRPSGINPAVPMTTAPTPPGSPVPASPGAAMTTPGNATNGNGSSGNGATTTTSNSPTAGLQGGANSFTEGQARSRLDGAGYANITGLTKDKDGIWRGRAMHGGSPVDVAVDYKGNVVAR